MGIARLQLLSQGAQDVYLTGTPKVSLFRAVYHRHTNFSMETVQLIFESQPTWGSHAIVEVSKHGDLLHSMFLRVTAPHLEQTDEDKCEYIRYCNSFCHAFVKLCQLKIGGQLINSVTGDWLEVSDELSNSETKKVGYGHAVGKQYVQNIPDDYHTSTQKDTFETHMGSRRSITFFLPIRFHMRSSDLAIPLLCLRHHQVTVDFDFRKFHELINWKWPSSAINALPIPSLVSDSVGIEFFGIFVYLDTEEKDAMLRRKHEYLFEQYKQVSYETNNRCNLELPFKHPVKEVIWSVSKKENRDRNVYFDYGEHDTERVRFAQLTLDQEPVLPRIEPKYLRTVVPYTYHTRVPKRHLYCHSFALQPEATFPTGSCNFSRFRSTNLLLELDKTHQEYLVDVHAVSYNVLRIMNGTASVGFS